MSLNKVKDDLENDVDLTAIYTAFITKATLEDADREKLKKERGFSDVTIDALKFKSCSPANGAIIKELETHFGQDALLRAGILEKHEDTGNVKPCFQLLQGPDGKLSNICIPYFTAKKEVFFIRPHKLGLKDMPIQIYAPVRPLDDTVIIAESEFKAAAAIQFGYKAIGLPGIHSFAANNFPRLVAFLKQFANIRKVVIMFDNEIKDNPAFPNFKPDVSKQWDTQWRSVQMAHMLSEQLGKKVTIAILPKDWMVDGKIDIDGALSQGRTQDEFKQVVDSSFLPRDYLNRIHSETGRKIVTRKYKHLTKSFKVKREDNCYWSLKTLKAKKEDDEPQIVAERISNFVLKINKVVVEGDRVREVIFTGEDGTVSKPFYFHSDDLVLARFKCWVHKCGYYVFKGKQEDLEEILEMEEGASDCREIKKPQEIGYLKQENPPIWLFGNCLVKEDTGEVLLPDANGVIWNGLQGFEPRSIKESEGEGASGEEASTTKMPIINIHDSVRTLLKKGDDDHAGRSYPHLDTKAVMGIPEIKEVVDKLVKNFNNNRCIELGVGWVIACLLSEEIFKKYACFPILFIGGKRESGKTTLGNWLMAMMGFSDISGDPLSSTTRPGVARNLSWYSSLGYWLDEYRNDKKTLQQWEGYFRNIYQRQASSKGTLKQTIRSEEVNAGVILSGEDVPQDNALRGRCLIIPLTKTARNQAVYNEIETLRQNGLLSRLTYEVVIRKSKILPDILNDIGFFKDRLLKQGVGERVAINYAIPAACFNKLFLDNDIEAAKDFVQWVAKDAHRVELEKEKEHMLNIFLDDLVTLQENLKEFYSVYKDEKAVKGKRTMAFHFKSFYSLWAESFRKKGGEQFSCSTMLEYMKEEPYYLLHDKQMRIGTNNKNTRCTVVSLDPEDKPHPSFLTLADGAIDVPPDEGSTSGGPSKPFNDTPI